jgi:hypothetical protein
MGFNGKKRPHTRVSVLTLCVIRRRISRHCRRYSKRTMILPYDTRVSELEDDQVAELTKDNDEKVGPPAESIAISS